jgi:hypothetical protein
VFFGLAHNKPQNNFKKNLQTKNKLKLKHLEIEWNVKKLLVFSHLHKAKERGNINLKSKAKPRRSFFTLAQSKRKRQYQFEEQSKTTRCVEEQRNKNSSIRRRPRINKEVP